MRSPKISQPNTSPKLGQNKADHTSSSSLAPSHMEVKNTFLEVVEPSNREPWRLRGMHSGCRSAGTTPVLWPKAAFPERDPLNPVREHLISRAVERTVPADRPGPDADPRYVEISEPLDNPHRSVRSSPYLGGYPSALSPQAPMWPATPEWLPFPSSDMRHHFLSGPAMTEGNLLFPTSVDESPFEVLWGALGEDKLDPPPMQNDDDILGEVKTLKAKKPPQRPQDSPLLSSVTQEEPEEASEEPEGLAVVDSFSSSLPVASEPKPGKVLSERPIRERLQQRGGKGQEAKGEVDATPVPCRAFAAKGQCRFGQQCRFSHDATSILVGGGSSGSGQQIQQHWNQSSNPKRFGKGEAFGQPMDQQFSQSSNSKGHGKGGQAIAPQMRAPSEVAVPNNSRRKWTVIWCDEQAFKASGADNKKDLEDLGMIIKAYKTAANCIRSLNKKLLPVLPCCLVISSMSNAGVLVPYLAERPALVRGVIVLAEAGQEEVDTSQQNWGSTVKVVAPNWENCMAVVKSIMDGR